MSLDSGQGLSLSSLITSSTSTRLTITWTDMNESTQCKHVLENGTVKTHHHVIIKPSLSLSNHERSISIAYRFKVNTCLHKSDYISKNVLSVYFGKAFLINETKSQVCFLKPVKSAHLLYTILNYFVRFTVQIHYTFHSVSTYVMHSLLN